MKTKLDHRQHTIDLLRRTGAAFRWHPILVDVALDVTKSPGSIAAIIRDAAFTEECRIRSAFCPSLQRALDGDFTRLLDPAVDTLSPFYFSVLRRACGGFSRLHDDRNCREQMLEIVRFMHIKHVQTFKPGDIAADGPVRFFGFKAYFERWLPSAVRDEFFKWHCKAARVQSLDDPEHPRQEPATDRPCIDALTLEDCLGAAIHTPYEARLFWLFVANEAGLEDCAEIYRCSQGKIHGDLKAIFVRFGQKLSGKSVPNPDIHRCRKALASMVPPERLADWLLPISSGRPSSQALSL
jgi:hypothetical protein